MNEFRQILIWSKHLWPDYLKTQKSELVILNILSHVKFIFSSKSNTWNFVNEGTVK